MILPINANTYNRYCPKINFKGQYFQYAQTGLSISEILKDQRQRSNPKPVGILLGVLSDKNIQQLLNEKSISYEDIVDITDYPFFNIFREFSTGAVLKSLKNEKTRDFISKYKLQLYQAPLVSKVPPKQLEAFKNALNSLRGHRAVSTNIVKLQQKQGYQIEVDTKTCLDEDTHTLISFHISVDSDCNVQCTRIERPYCDTTLSRLKNSNCETFVMTKNPQDPYIHTIIEFTKQDATCYRLSDKLQGAWEISKYEYKNYPIDYDIKEGIQKGTIKGGRPISRITEDDNSIVYKEIFHTKDTTTKRRYEESYDGSYRSYEYNITQNSETLLNLKRSWRKISDTETVTVVNDKTYRAFFDDLKRTVTILDNKGNTTTINLARKAPYHSFEFLKTLDVDTLLNIKKYTRSLLFARSDENKSYNFLSNSIKVDENPFSINHELGHAIDYNSDVRFYRYPELIKIYNQELEEFNKVSNSKIKDILQYFSNDGGYAPEKGDKKISTGINELVAETNAILHTYNDTEEVLSSRVLYLIRYFPKTIAYIASLLDV
ncbi:MAG: hypothetical protein IJ877_03045 [Candidatus Gastranaerophilales bacterium]|nr:hypothetical protein [Candidatus Gastranaerophilales bacterium]